MKRVLATLMVMGTLLFLAVPAMSDDRVAPPWRGEDSTTLQGWEFLDDVMPDYPDWGEAIDPSGNHVAVLSSTVMTADPAPGQEWMPTYEGANGVWPLGIFDVLVDNWPEGNLYKYVWVQLTWAPTDAGLLGKPKFSDFDPLPSSAVNLISKQPLDPGDPSSPWMHSVHAWRIDDNPEDEFFILSGDIYVDEMVIDTVCTSEWIVIPEPSTVAMLFGAGLVSLLAYAYRRRG